MSLSLLPDGMCPPLAHRCLRNACLVTCSGPPCWAHSPRSWGRPSCRLTWTVISTARCRCVSACAGCVSGVGDPAGVTTPTWVSQSPRTSGLCPSLQPLLFAVDTGCGVFRHRSISPSSLLDTAISEEARQSQGLEEEQEAQKPLPGSTGRRHTLAEVSTCFPCAPPSKCPCGPRTQPGGVTA